MKYGRRQNKHVVYQQKPNIRWNEPNRYQVPHIYLVKRILDSVPNFLKNDFVLTKCIMILARATVFLNLSTMLGAYFWTIVCSMWHYVPWVFLAWVLQWNETAFARVFYNKKLAKKQKPSIIGCWNISWLATRMNTYVSFVPNTISSISNITIGIKQGFRDPWYKDMVASISLQTW